MIDKIKEIFINNKERYGYRRITLELRNQGYNVNHKKVYRIMVKLDLKPLKRNKRKYSSYKGTVGKIADNYIINLIKNGVQILLNLILEEKNVIYHQ
ncbi:MAG: transposase [Bacilli bacterium]|nr:transposase [Bacilli bacterium]